MGLILQMPHLAQNRAKFHLTRKGKEALSHRSEGFNGNDGRIQSIVNEIKDLEFRTLLKKVYLEAPEFATSYVARQSDRRSLESRTQRPELCRE
jgi:hypothetical protein